MIFDHLIAEFHSEIPLPKIGSRYMTLW